MSAVAMDIHDYINTLAAVVPENLPGAAQVAIHQWIGEMHQSANDGDSENLARCARLISQKVKQELQWQREGAGTS